MAEIHRLRGDPHEEVQALLPWLVNGTLAPEIKARLEAHLGECAACRAELESEHRLARGIARMPLNVDQNWSAMKQRMAHGGSRAPMPARRRFWGRRVTIGWAVAAPIGAAAAVALLFLAVPLEAPREQTYHALGSPDVATHGNLVVQFKPDATERQMRLILRRNEARLVDGPTAAGAYVLRVDDAQRDQIVRKLRQFEAIVLAEPIEPPAAR
jgi:hypothetical protein